MKNLLNLFIFIWMNLGVLFHSHATHIVGADLYYECINPTENQYRIILTMYRDCLAGQAPFDNPVMLFIFSSTTGQVVQNIDVPIPPTTPVLEFENLELYTTTPPLVCVEEGVYTTVIQLPPLTGGYDIAWSRCCRNAAIDNLRNPLAEGVTFLAHVPDPSISACNSMPQYDKKPPFLLCANQPFSFDFSATDPDGDSLSYVLANPYNGLNSQGIGTGNPNQGGPVPTVDPFNNPMGPPPYRSVEFAPGFSYEDPIGSGNAFIDPVSGFFTATPNRSGIFVFAFSVFEWRNGELISENRRDLQMHVINCSEQESVTDIVPDSPEDPANGDTVMVRQDSPFSYEVSISNSNPLSTIEAYPVSAAFVSRGNTAPATFSYTGTNPVRVKVEWQPSCDYAGQIVPLIIGAESSDAFPNVSNIFDTVYVRVDPSENIPPEVFTFTDLMTFEEDTILINATERLYYPIAFIDYDSEFPMDLSLAPLDFIDPNPPTLNIYGRSPLVGILEWYPDTSLVGKVVPLNLQAIHRGECVNAIGSTTHTIYVRIQVSPIIIPPIKNPTGTYPHTNETYTMLARKGKILNENQSGYSAIVFPNPVINQLNVVFKDPVLQMTPWRITNIFGQSIKEGIFTGKESVFQVNVVGIAEGQYLLHIGDSEKTWTHYKLIISE